MFSQLRVRIAAVPVASRLSQQRMTRLAIRCMSTPPQEYRKVKFENDAKPFDKILVANRGEIACRVMRTAQKLGIKTVAIYSEPDMRGEHVQMADEAYCVGPAASSESYLNVPKIMEVIKKTGAQAVHPGYGFLSENSEFCKTLEENNIAFIGPGHHAIEAMGDKIESKEFAIKAGVSTVPGSLDLISDEDMAVRVANEVGYPVMIKASAGGGGKGMRIAWNDAETKRGLKLSKEEAKSSFGDDRIFIEKFVEEPRHIEIQLVGDSHGNVLTLPERECSIQRRNQKVLEESPSPFLDPETRAAMQAQAAALAHAVDYKSAGTVEFLVDKHKNFYFLEMNTRLQVEHPVTELVSGVDLVELMIYVAAGQPIPQELLKEQLPINGWAMEARVYAEDPFRGFLPSIGRLIDYCEPTQEEVPGLRVDSGVTQGSDISMYYDPMISKTISHGATRIESIDLLCNALDRYVVRGVGHNINFLRDVCRHPRYREGTITTKFIEEEYPDGFDGVVLSEAEQARLALLSVLQHREFHRAKMVNNGGQIDYDFLPESMVSVVDKLPFVVEVDDDEPIGPAMARVTSKDGKEYMFPSAAVVDFNMQLMEGEVSTDGETFDTEVVQLLKKTPLGYQMQYQGAICDVQVLSKKEYELTKHMPEKKELDFTKMLVSPMPGALVSLSVKEGDEVFPGQEVCVVEAMKMQNVLYSEVNAKVKKVHCETGATLAVDEIIIEFE